MILEGFPFYPDTFGGCPPEDVSGPWGYQEFGDASDNNKHPEYRSNREWQGLDLKTP
ncbi:pRiA4b ORF-3-like protein [Cyclobacterium lianum]|uniref:PRiA4b ORF-3-like protein n=1 Tax=Cyclobacterium lianum TaxID=388280 RepID=A0A1M7NK06_9BACT|nr:plasmid pRiA4b ORF-3 family protein [Cyclobacterium lianum]SHN04184.1 pRiA4b ORF-3-like protein [Cyclobacterium lianum]